MTSGPGATNTVTGLFTALMDSAPVVVLCGQVNTPIWGPMAFRRQTSHGITYPVVKHSYLVKRSEEIPRIVHEAFYLATTGRPGPVLIDVPKDVSQGPCEAPFTDEVDLPGYGVPTRGDPTAILRSRGVPDEVSQAGSVRGAGRGDLRCGQVGRHARREAPRSHGEHIAREGRCGRDPPPPPRHARNARNSLREQGSRRLRSDHVDRSALGRSRHREGRCFLPRRGQDPRRHRSSGVQQDRSAPTSASRETRGW